MAEIISFPGGAERLNQEIERTLEEQLKISNPELKECIKKRVSGVLARHSGIPTLSTSVTLPPGVTENDIEPVIQALQKEYSEKVMEFGLGLITEICLLEAHLCKVELGLA